jgi:hypothetical protein
MAGSNPSLVETVIQKSEFHYMNFDWLNADLYETVQAEGNGKKPNCIICQQRLHTV